MQTKTKMWIVIVAGLLIAGCATYYYVASSSLSSNCSSSVLTEVPSPDGRYIATAFERNCGATSPYVRIVSIRPEGTRLRPEDDGSWVFATKDQPNIGVSWSGPRQLTVVTGGYSRTPSEQRLKTAHWKDVGIVIGPS
jgi:hypothetical protein